MQSLVLVAGFYILSLSHFSLLSKLMGVFGSLLLASAGEYGQWIGHDDW